MKDYCTFFPEYWFTWSKHYKGWFETVYIGDLCKEHDIKCSFSNFFMGLWERRVVGTVLIALIAGLFCWIRHPKLMIKRWKD